MIASLIGPAGRAELARPPWPFHGRRRPDYGNLICIVPAGSRSRPDSSRGLAALGQRRRGGSWVAVCGQPHTSSLRVRCCARARLPRRWPRPTPDADAGRHRRRRRPWPPAPPAVAGWRASQRCGTAGASRPGSIAARAREDALARGRGGASWAPTATRDDVAADAARAAQDLASTCGCRSAPRAGRWRSWTATARCRARRPRRSRSRRRRRTRDRRVRRPAPRVLLRLGQPATLTYVVHGAAPVPVTRRLWCARSDGVVDRALGPRRGRAGGAAGRHLGRARRRQGAARPGATCSASRAARRGAGAGRRSTSPATASRSSARTSSAAASAGVRRRPRAPGQRRLRQVRHAAGRRARRRRRVRRLPRPAGQLPRDRHEGTGTDHAYMHLRDAAAGGDRTLASSPGSRSASSATPARRAPATCTSRSGRRRAGTTADRRSTRCRSCAPGAK